MTRAQSDDYVCLIDRKNELWPVNKTDDMQQGLNAVACRL